MEVLTQRLDSKLRSGDPTLLSQSGGMWQKSSIWPTKTHSMSCVHGR